MQYQMLPLIFYFDIIYMRVRLVAEGGDVSAGEVVGLHAEIPA